MLEVQCQKTNCSYQEDIYIKDDPYEELVKAKELAIKHAEDTLDNLSNPTYHHCIISKVWPFLEITHGEFGFEFDEC